MSSDEQDWQALYETGDTGWDLGAVSPPLKNYINQLEDKTLRILIPGGGNSYEAEYLFQNGYTNVNVVDIAAAPLQNIKTRCPAFPPKQLHHLDFFEMHGSFDLILEQTFLCALPPTLRPEYELKMKNLLRPNGKLTGLLFDFPLTNEGPPFGGDEKSYRELFEPHFEIAKMERCYNSVEKRSGRELFISLRPRSS